MTRPVRLLLCCLLWGSLVARVLAVPASFNIPAQPASGALLAFSKQAGANVLFSYRDLRRVRSNAVVGSFEKDDALRLLLRGTGFGFTREAPDRYIVTREENASATGTISGRVVTRDTERPISGALVRIPGTALRAVTDAKGAFSLAAVPAGQRIVSIVGEEFAAVRIDDVRVAPGETIPLGTVHLTVARDGDAADDVVINASRPDAVGAGVFALQKVYVSPSRFGLEEERSGLAAMLTQEDLAALPQVGEDLYRSIAHLPGLTADDYTARFWVRGAPQENVLSRLDGVDLIEPFHARDTDGSLSIVDLQSISRLNLFTGGFTAEYGGRLAGVLEMETEEYAGSRPRTTVSLSYTGARLATRGSTRGGRIRWLATARLGLLEHVVDSAAEAGDARIKPKYHDLGGKLEFDLGPRQTLSLHFLQARDRMTISADGDPDLGSTYGSAYAWARWQAKIGDALQNETVLACTRLTSKRSGTGHLDQFWPVAVTDERSLRQWSLRDALTYGVSSRLLLQAGVEAASGRAAYDYNLQQERPTIENGVVRAQTVQRALSLNPDGTRESVYATARFQPLENLTLETGLRYEGNSQAGDADISPRVSAAWAWHRTTLRAAWGFYRQAQALQDLSVPDGEVAFQPSERAEHRIVGVEQRFGAGLSLRLEAYERRVDNPRTRWENVYGGLDTFPELEGDRVRFDPVVARARGVELVAEQRIDRRFKWSASYVRSRTQETLRGGQVIPRRRDQRDALYLDFTYTPDAKWLFSIAWQYHSGWPVTEQQFTAVPLADGSLAWTSLPGPLYGQRLPEYQRLDLRAERIFRFRRSELRVYADLFNALNRRNVISYKYETPAATDGSLKIERRDGDKLFPILPSLGASLEF